MNHDSAEPLLVQQFQMIVGRMKETPRLGGVLSRLVRFAEPDPMSPAMLERLCVSEPSLLPFVQRGLVVATKRFQLKSDPSITACVGHLGVHRVQRIVLVSALGSYAMQCMPRSGIRCLDVVRQGIGRGVFAARFGKYAQPLSPEVLFQLGVLSVIGIPLMAFVFGRRYQEIYLSLDGKADRLVERESAELGMDHVRAATMILEQFSLGEDQLECMSNLDEAPESVRGPTQALILGSILAHEAGFDGGLGSSAPEFRRAWIIRLGVQEAELPKITLEAESEAQWAELIMGAALAA